MLQIILLHAVYGLTFTISKILIQYANPVFVIGIRMVLAGILLLAIASLFRKNKITYDKQTVWGLLQIAIFSIFIPYSLRYWSLKHLTVAKTAFIYNLSPFISFIFAYFLLKERLSPKKLLGMGIGFASIIPMFIFTDPGETSHNLFSGVSLAELILLLSVTSFCYGWIVIKKLHQHQNIFHFALNGRAMIIGGALSLLTAFASSQPCTIAAPAKFFPWLFLIILLTNFFYYSLYTHLLKKHSATLISLGSLVAPISASITGWLYFGEVVTINTCIAGVCIIIGLCIFFYDEIKKQKNT